MSELNTEQLSKIAYILRVAVVNRALTSLEFILSEPIECEYIQVLNTALDNDNNFDEFISVYIKGNGDLTLSLLMLLSIEDAKWIASRMIGENVEVIDYLSISAISELGNMLLVGSFINALANITGFKIDCSVPGFAMEHYRSILQYAILENYNATIIANIMLLCKESNKRLRITLLLDPENAKKILC